MKIKDIHKLAVQKGIEADLRGKKKVEKVLLDKKEMYERLSSQDKEDFDREALENPYLDSRILNISEDKEIKKVLVGIDIDSAELLIAKEIGDIDLVISHHPSGKGLSNLHDVMELQADVLSNYGVPINVAEGLMRQRISEVARGINGLNHQKTVDAAGILGFNFMCLHTTSDNLAANFLKEKVEKEPEIFKLRNLMDLLNKIPEYQEAAKIGVGPKIIVGDPERRCGKIVLTEITGGTEGSPKIYEKMAQAGIGTVVGMHQSEEHRRQAEAANINVVIAGHISSDSIGMNLILDELEKRGIEIIPCSGLIRVSRVAGSKNKVRSKNK